MCSSDLNVERIEHVPPSEHPDFYAASRFTLNVTRADMIRAGYSPSVRLFEAGSCATPIVSDLWDGIETLLEPGREIVLSDTADDVLRTLLGMSEPQRLAMAAAARRRVLGEHTAEHRAQQLETYLGEARKKAERPRRATVGAATA